ncbi:MAG: hypothetical protein RSC24_06430 [Clostridium sp.]
MKREEVVNVQNEILTVGAMYKNTNLYIEYGRFIKSDFDFCDEVTRFLYDSLALMYETFTQDVDENKINTFMSQDNERFKTYRKYGGFKLIKQWMGLSNPDDFKNYLEMLKKYSILREFNDKGYDVERIMNHKKFHVMKASDVAKIIRSGVDKISTNILSNEESVVMNENNRKQLKNYLIKPDMGLEMPFEIMNEMFKGMRLGKFFCNGMLSNEGKTRLATSIASYIAFVKQEKVLVMCNETSEEDFRACLLVSVINNKWFKTIHGLDVEKTEKELTLGIYRDDVGNIIERLIDKNGNFSESEEEYIERVYKTSSEFRKVDKVAQWIETNLTNKIFFKYLDDYSDDMLEFEIRKHNTVHNVKYFFYDTLKCYKEENWGMLKQTGELLQKLCLQLKMFGWGSLQLTDDSVITDIFSLSSMNIASAKQLKHILDHLALSKTLSREDYHKYQYIPNSDNLWGSTNVGPFDLNKSKRYVAIKIEKNRGGSKDKIILLETDLNVNTWYEIGQLVKKKKQVS